MRSVASSPCAIHGLIARPATAIQAAITAANDGDTIVVAPGIYAENVILYKNVKLQGSGAGSTTIFATPLPAERWREVS